MYAPIIDLSLLLFWAFFITVKESPSISTNFNPKSLPSITVCKHATALATNPKETLLQRPPFCNYWTKDQITQMVQIKVWQISVLLFNTIQPENHPVESKLLGFGEFSEHLLQKRFFPFGAHTSSSTLIFHPLPTLQHSPVCKRPFAAHILFQVYKGGMDGNINRASKYEINNF